MLLKKLFRTLWRYKAQFISMVIMIALGIGVFLGFNIEWYSLDVSTREIYDATGFADFRIYSEKGFSEKDLEAIRVLPDVEDATRYLSFTTTVRDDKDMIALTVNENMAVSGLLVMEGEEYDASSLDGIWLSDQYAAKNGLTVGDSLTLTYKNYAFAGVIRGLIKSSEYLICLPDENQMMPDYNTYGFAYISPEAFKSIIPVMFRGLIGDSFYAQINVKSPLTKAAFTKEAEEALGKTLLILSKEENLCWSESNGEIEEGKTMGSILPVLFLGIAVLTMVTTMHRITASEKTQIGTLKALGFHDSRILRHYSAYALFIGIIGSALGVGIGYLLAWYIMSPGGAMATYIDMRSWNLYVPWFGWIVIVVMIAALTLLGWLSVKNMLKGTAADALRPYTPTKMRHLAVEETKTFKKLGFGTKWNLRDCFRHKARTFMTLFGIIGCMVLLVGGLGMKDTADAFISVFFDQAINYQTRINLDAESASNEEAIGLAEQYGADWSAQTSVQVGDKGYALEVYNITHDLVRFPGEDMNLVPLTDSGAYISARMAKAMGLNPGDALTFSPYDSDKKYTVTVAGVLRSMTESIVMTDAYADSVGYDYAVNTLYTDETDIASDSRILNSQPKQMIMDSFDMFMELMNTMIVLLVLAAVILGIVVLYNLGVMSYVERYREMATLKVVGFKDRAIGRLLIGQNLWLSVLGVLIGLPAGVGVLQYLLDALASEYEMKLAIGLLTYIISILLTMGVSMLVGVMVARKNRHIDMVAALKTEE